MKSTNQDKLVGSTTESIADSRFKALKSISELSNKAICGISNWIQVGPTAIPKGNTISNYYYWAGLLSRKDVKDALVTGRVTAIVLDPSDSKSDTIYVGTALGGVWKTTDGGRNWFPISDDTDSMAIGALAIDPLHSEILYAGTGEGNFAGDSYYGLGVLKTLDGGKQWSSCGDLQRTLFINSRFCRLVISPNPTTTLFAAVRSNQSTSSASGIYRSIDSGNTWERLNNGLPPIEDTLGATDFALGPDSGSKIAYAAFYGVGVYKSEDVYAEEPSWTLLELKDFSPGRICLTVSPSSPNIVYVIASDSSEYVNQFYRTTNSGVSWERIKITVNKDSSPWEDGTIGGQGSYNLNVAVDPHTPDVVYLSGISLWKAVRNGATNEWTFYDIGKEIHADNHTLAFDPANSFVIYSGNDGGIYKSIDGGETWNDTINEGLCITQFEFMEQHPSSDVVAFAGAQDNGTLQFRNTSVFYLADGGDGGHVCIDRQNPHNIIHQYTKSTLFHSTQAGREDSWIDISPPIGGYPSSFYAPFALNTENVNSLAFAAKDLIIFDKNQGLDGWRNPQGKLDYVKVPNMDQSYITAIHYVSSGLVYVGTDHGKVFRLTADKGSWNPPVEIHATPSLPDRWIWDISTYPKKSDTIVVVMSGFSLDLLGGSHIWRGMISVDGSTVWEDISPRNDKNEIIDIPVNCLAIDEKFSNNLFIGTDIGVFRSTDNGKSWQYFSEGLPKCAVYDMRLLYEPEKLLRVVTHGRGMWERRLDKLNIPAIDIFVRDHLMDSGRVTPSSSFPQSATMRSAFEDLFQHENPDDSTKLGSELRWYMSPDIKIDNSHGESSSYQLDSGDVDYVKFETTLYHRNPKRARVNRMYVQIHNRGIRPVNTTAGEKVIVKVLYANYIEDSNLPPYFDLPKDFWSKFPDNSNDTSYWKPIGGAKILPSGPKTVTNTEPTIIEWDWYISPEVANRVWLLLIADCTADPIPESNKLFDLERLARNEKHIAVKLVDISST